LTESDDPAIIYVRHPVEGRQAGANRAIRWRQIYFLLPAVLFPHWERRSSPSIGCLLESRGFKVTLQKCDPLPERGSRYDEPLSARRSLCHEDGAETDLTSATTSASPTLTSRDNNWTTGRIYETILTKSAAAITSANRSGHSARNDESKRDQKVSDGVDVVIVEIGGTVGDIESLPFLEAIRQMRLELGAENTLFVHVTLVPFIAAAGELKTKPTQHT